MVLCGSVRACERLQWGWTDVQQDV